jgi:hypothetical protein
MESKKGCNRSHFEPTGIWTEKEIVYLNFDLVNPIILN